LRRNGDSVSVETGIELRSFKHGEVELESALGIAAKILFKDSPERQRGRAFKNIVADSPAEGNAQKIFKIMIKTVIFDMDGVIVDTEPVHYRAYQQHFKDLDIHVPVEMYATFTGNSTKNVYEKLKAAFGIAEETEKLVDIKRALFNDAFDSKEDLFLLEGVENLIKDLYQNGMQLILASSSAKVTIDRIFRRFHLHQYFCDIVSGEDFPKSKPDPAIFEKAVELSGMPKENCIVIEDSANGIKAAKAAGIYCIGYDSLHSKLQDLSEADRVIKRFDELDFEKISHLK
jgi:HAD superfamily hydrolase (TIGR01509 family)